MIIYGWRTKTSAMKPLEMGSCAKCAKGPLSAFTAWSYFHIYWIPLFPYRRKLWLTCGHCQAAYEPGAETPEGSLPGIESAKARPPLYMFSGLAVLASIIIAIVVANHHDKERYHAMLSQPQVGDLIVMRLPHSKDPKFSFGIAKVVSLSGEEIHLAPSTYQFSTSSNAQSEKSMKLLRASDAFADEELVYKKTMLLQFLEDGTITAAIRGAAGAPAPEAPKGVKLSVQ